MSAVVGIMAEMSDTESRMTQRLGIQMYWNLKSRQYESS